MNNDTVGSRPAGYVQPQLRSSLGTANIKLKQVVKLILYLSWELQVAKKVPQPLSNAACLLWWKDVANKEIASPLLAAPSSPHILCTRGWMIGDARRLWVLCIPSVWFCNDTSSHEGTEPAWCMDVQRGESWLQARHSRICSSILQKRKRQRVTFDALPFFPQDWTISS